MSEVRDLPLDRVFADPNQPRKIFEPGAIMELAASIRQSGLIQPITVRKFGVAQYRIVTGERRWRAHQYLGAETILARVVELGDTDLLVAQIVENAQRQDMTPLEEAAAYQRLVDQLDGDVRLAAIKLGKSPHRLTERLCLLQLRPEYQNLLASGNLSPSEAFELAQLSLPAQDKLFAAIKKGLCPNYNALRAAALALRENDAQGAMFDMPAPTEEERATLSALERRIDQVCRVLAAGWSDGECVTAKRVNPQRARQYAEKLALIQKHLIIMENALRAAAVQSSVFDD